MKELMERLIPELKDVFQDMRERDIHILPDPNFLPAGVKFPCIGLKDGRIRITELAGEAEDLLLPVEIYYFDQLKRGNDYLLDFLARRAPIRAALKNNTLGGYVTGVSPTTETPITLMTEKRGLIMRKGLFYEYEKEE